MDGAPDLDQETAPRYHADTSGGDYLRLIGSRPDLIYHQVSGFTVPAEDRYEKLVGQRWRPFATGPAKGVGVDISPWSKGRLLELRASNPQQSRFEGHRVPWMRVFRGAPGRAPSLPTDLVSKLEGEGFFVEDFAALDGGEVVVVGSFVDGRGFGTLLWHRVEDPPAYFHTEEDLDHPLTSARPSANSTASKA